MSSLSSPYIHQRTKRAPKVKQACDCCHARKIKCDGTKPCNNCQTIELQCTYLNVPKKKGPKGPSKRMPRSILKMQMEQQKHRSQETVFVTASPPPSISSTLSSPPQDLNSNIDHSASHFEPSPLLTLAVAEEFAASFFKYKYPLTPILHKDDFYSTLPSFLYCPQKYALVASLCAAVLTQVRSDQQSVSAPDPSKAALITDFFISEAKRARTAWDYIEKPSLQDVHTSFFIFAGLFDCDRHNSAWFHLRESITLLETLRLHEEETYLCMPARPALFSRRTFWLLVITERAYALQRHRPLTLSCTIALPVTTPTDPDATIIAGFLDLVALFRNFDKAFLDTWNHAARAPFAAPAAMSAAQLAALQATLSHCVPEEGVQRTDIQRADLSITRLWLSTTTWHLCVSLGLLSSSPSAPTPLSFHHPILLSSHFASLSASLPLHALRANGPGILEKIFDIGCALADVLALGRSGEAGRGRMDAAGGGKEYLRQMLRVLEEGGGGGRRFAGLLGEKAEGCWREGPRGGVGGEGDVVVARGVCEWNGETAGDGVEAERDVGMGDLAVLGAVSATWLGGLDGRALEVQVQGGRGPEVGYQRCEAGLGSWGVENWKTMKDGEGDEDGDG